ncbi:MAG: arginine--tRNA ligase [Defluviitaleaceae bacterium]|nr:arginine--tRNA ligase [Defluviitaleaceae bacterium]
MDFKVEIAGLIGGVLGLEPHEVADWIETPPEPEMGDFAYPCFRLAKSLKKAPPAIAEEIAGGILMPPFLDRVEVSGAYVNFFVKRDFYASQVLGKIYAGGANFGRSSVGGGGCVVIDYSSPNIAKPFHIGHLRSTVIGHALYNIFEHLGYRSFSINYLGDWGTQFGKVITGYKRWGTEDVVNAEGIAELNRLYVKFHEEAEKDATLEEEARGWLLKMEQGDEYALKLWKWFKDISLDEYAKIYKLLDIEFDSEQGESFYNDKMTPIVDELREKGLLVESDGAMIVELEAHGISTPCMILRRDGGTLYATRDITSALHRKSEYNFVKSLYVTGNEQSLHFAQFFKVVELMGYDFDMHHVPFGKLRLAEGKMSTRKGRVLLMEDLLNQTIDKIKEIIDEKNPDLADKDAVASQVGIGAVIFNDLYNGRTKDVEFSWERMLNFEGETGPYVQYTHARCSSVLEKAGIGYADADLSRLVSDEEFELIKTLNSFPEKIAEAAEKLEPFIISRYVMNVAQTFNKFYHESPILKVEDELKKARLHLTHCTQTVIASALGILGIKSPEKM